MSGRRLDGSRSASQTAAERRRLSSAVCIRVSSKPFGHDRVSRSAAQAVAGNRDQERLPVRPYAQRLARHDRRRSRDATQQRPSRAHTAHVRKPKHVIDGSSSVIPRHSRAPYHRGPHQIRRRPTQQTVMAWVRPMPVIGSLARTVAPDLPACDYAGGFRVIPAPPSRKPGARLRLIPAKGRVRRLRTLR